MKRTFIPTSHRPTVKGTFLKSGPGQFSYVKNLNSKKEDTSAIVLIGVYDDDSQFKLIINEIKERPLAVLFFDDLGVHWNFSFFHSELTFNLNGKSIKPEGIYYRGYGTEESDPRQQLFLNLQEAIELWEGRVIGALTKHHHNASKALQLVSTIHQAIKMSQMQALSFPDSFFIKGPPSLLHTLLKDYDNLIVKSCSYIRSKVVNKNDFLSWETDRLANLPVFFQVYVEGMDMRIHVLKSKVWAILIETKDGVDFRYARNRSKYQKTTIPLQLRQFARKLGKIEQIALSGIDIITSKNQFFCLECNPNPGWAGFHRFSGDEQDIARSILKIIGTKKR